MKSEPKKPKKKPAAKTAKITQSTARPSSKSQVKRTKTAGKTAPGKSSPTAPAKASIPESPKPARKAAGKSAASASAASTAMPKAASGTKTPARKRPAIPPALLEGDTSPAQKPGPSGRGDRYVLGQDAPGGIARGIRAMGELPESYGTQRIFLAARDPHWLYASWDLTREQRQDYNGRSADGHLVVRTFLNSVSGEPLVETHVHPESRSWFIHVGRGGARYVAELGYRGRDGRWHSISKSSPTTTPSDRLSEDDSVRFATLPADVKFEEVIAAVSEVLEENLPIVEAIRQLREQGHTALPAVSVATPPAELKWTPAHTAALAKVVRMDEHRRVWMGSLEITQLIRRQLEEELSSIALARAGGGEAGAAGPPAFGISSPVGGAKQDRGFWFNINAELIIYGATDPGANVTISGRAVKLRPDGTFSFRFALPDGEYDLHVAAEAPDGQEARRASLTFVRGTYYEGDVGAHPQDSRLGVPSPANVS